METTTILPTPPTSGAIVQSSGNGDFFSTWAGIEATNRNGAQNLAATHEANVSDLNAITNTAVATQKYISDGTISVTKNVNDGTTSVNKNVYDGIVSGLNATNLAAVATQKSISDTALASALAFGEVRNNIATESAVASINAKDIQLAIYKDGAHTREESAEAIAAVALQAAKDTAALALEACKNTDSIQREMAKGFADTQYKALEAKCALEAKIAEICCCTEKAVSADGERTRGLIALENQRRLEAELAEARLKAAIAGLGSCKEHDRK